MLNRRFNKIDFKLNKIADREKYKGIPIDIVILPENIENDLDSSNFSDYTLDKIKIFLNILFLTKIDRESGYCRIHSDRLENLDKNYRCFIKYLKENEFILTTEEDQGIIDYSNFDEVGLKSRGYKLHSKYMFNKSVDIHLSKPFWINASKTGKTLKRYFESHIDSIEKNWVARISMYYQQDKESIVLPDVKLIEDKAELMVENNMKNKKDKTYRFFDENIEDKKEYMKNHVNIKLGIDQFKQLKTYGWTLPIGSNCGRTFDKFNQMSKWVRNEFKFNWKPKGTRKYITEDMVELDFTALHPNIWCLFLDDIPYSEKQFFLEHVAGDSHTKISLLTGLSRSEVKIIFLSFFNDKKTSIRTNKKYELIYKLYNENMPSLMDIILKTKEVYHGDTSTFLFKNEAILIESIMVYCYKNKYPVQHCFDAVYVPASVATEVKDYANELFKKELTTTIG